MFGVVLWSDADEGKAVFWCEDQGDLAFFDGKSDLTAVDASGFFDAGDMVHFDIRTESNLRKASNARLVEHQVCSDLPQALRRDAQASTPTTGTVVPFVQRQPRPVNHTPGLRYRE